MGIVFINHLTGLGRRNLLYLCQKISSFIIGIATAKPGIIPFFRAIALLIIGKASHQTIRLLFLQQMAIFIKPSIHLMAQAVLFPNLILPLIIALLQGGAISILRTNQLPLTVIDVTKLFLPFHLQIGIGTVSVLIKEHILLPRT